MEHKILNSDETKRLSEKELREYLHWLEYYRLQLKKIINDKRLLLMQAGKVKLKADDSGLSAIRKKISKFLRIK